MTNTKNTQPNNSKSTVEPTVNDKLESTLNKYRFGLAVMAIALMGAFGYYEVRLMFHSDMAGVTKRNTVELDRLRDEQILLERRLSDAELRNRQLVERLETVNQTHQRNFQQLWEQVNREPVKRVR
jgi:hypothetical protein